MTGVLVANFCASDCELYIASGPAIMERIMISGREYESEYALYYSIMGQVRFC